MPKLRVSRSLLFPLFLLTLPLVAATPAAAGDGIWTPLGPEGAEVTALVVDPSDPDVVYAGANLSGVFKSTDGGATWGFAGRGIGSAVVVAFVVDPVHPGTVYAAGEEGAVFKTTDGGAGWVRVWAGAPFYGDVAPLFALVIDARRPGTLFAGTLDGLYRSTDAGATWARRGPNLGPVRCLAYDAAGGWLYAGVDTLGVLRSATQGHTWKQAGPGLPPGSVVTSLAFAPDQPQILLAAMPEGLYRSVDGGGRWRIAGGVPQKDAEDAVFQRRGRAYASFASGVFRSTDFGATWRRTGILPGRNGGEIQALAAGPAQVYAGTRYDADGPGLYRSLDAGATWEPAVAGLPGLSVRSVAVDPADGRVIYTAVGNSLYKTTDGGAHWTRLHLPLLGGGYYSVYDILIDPGQPATVWLVGFYYPRVLRSDDAGETWRPVGARGDPLYCLTLDPRASDAFWSIDGNSIIHSADGGATWEHSEMDTAGAFELRNVQVDPRDPAVVYAYGNELLHPRSPPQPRVFRSADGGVTWERRDAGLKGSFTGFAIDATDPATLYAITGYQLFRSTDDGASWTAAPGLPELSYSTVTTAPAAPGIPAAVYVISQFPANTVLRSTDRGETWTPLRRGLAPAIPRVLEVDPANPAHLLLGTENRSLLSYTLGGAQ